MIWPRKKKHNGHDEFIPNYVLNLITSTTAKFTRLIIEDSTSEIKRTAKNQLWVIVWSIKQLANHPNEDQLTLTLVCLEEANDISDDMLEIMKEKRINSLMILAEEER